MNTTRSSPDTVPDREVFGAYSDVQYIAEEDAGDLVGDEIHVIDTGRAPYVVYLSFDGGAAVPILAKAEMTGRVISFAFDEAPGKTVTFRGEIENCYLTGAFSYPHERKVKLHRESADCR